MIQFSHPYKNTGKTTALTIWTFDGKMMSLLFNMLSRIAQLVKNLPAMQKIPVQFLGWEDLLMEGEATHSRVAKSWTRLNNFHFHFCVV